MTDPSPQQVHVVSRAQVGEAERLCARMAEDAGFDTRAAAELRIVARELATNLVRHTPGGTITATRVERNGFHGLEIVAEDRGTGIIDLELALTDGYSSDGGLGAGLGAVDRLSDEVTISSPVEGAGGARVTACRWLSPQRRESPAVGLDVGVATRACPGQRLNGDAFVVQRWGTHLLVGVIDGLGHGRHAHRASLAARDYVERHPGRSMDDLFRGVARSCQATRGVVMALARIDGGERRFQFASIGNIDAHLLHPTIKADLRVRRGVLGGRAPRLVVTEHPWPAGAWLVMHSDGVSASWRAEAHAPLWSGAAQDAARELLLRHARERDDATVLTVRGTRRPEEGP